MIINETEKESKFKALISLIDEPDDKVYAEIFEKITNEGPNILPYLEHAWENSITPEVQKRIEELSHCICFKQLIKDLKSWLCGNMDLLEGVMIISRFKYPNLNEEEIYYEINRIRKEIWIELNENLTALEQIKVFNRVFYDILNFKGDVENYHDSRNSFINKVLETKKGNPLTLGVIYILLAQSLELPVYGVNLPEHFILAYTAKSINPDTLTINDNNVLFYINPFSNGSVFSYREVEEFLKRLNLDPKPSYINPCSNVDIITRMVNNLIVSFQKSGDQYKVSELETIISILKNH